MMKKLSRLFVLAAAAALLNFSDAQASIVLKVVAANPSKTQVQKSSVKAYLPKETKPEDVLDKGDLDIAFDTQQGSYFVFAEYELKPGETIEREVEIRDIWTVPDSEVLSLRAESERIMSFLKNTEFSDRAEFLKNSVESKLNQIVESKLSSPANPERHISDYRDTLRILESVKADLALARNLMTQYKPLPAVTIWKLIIGIIIFLGLLGASFYFIWQRQSKTLLQDPFYVPPQDSSAPGQVPRKHDSETKQPEEGP
jgi:hypothetical protein